MKKDINDLDDQLGLPLVNSLRTVSYRWIANDDGIPRLGLIAQELEGAFVNLGYTPGQIDMVRNEAQTVENGFDQYSVKYEALIPCLIKSVQQLTLQVAELKNQISDLQKNN